MAMMDSFATRASRHHGILIAKGKPLPPRGSASPRDPIRRLASIAMQIGLAIGFRVAAPGEDPGLPKQHGINEVVEPGTPPNVNRRWNGALTHF